MTTQTKREIRKVVRSKVADFDEQLWPTNVLILLTAGTLMAWIIARSRFDPRQTGILDNGFVQLGLVGLLVGLLVWAMAWLQSRGIRRVQFCVLLSLIVHLGLLAYLHRQHLSFLVRWQPRQTVPELVERERITVPDYSATAPGQTQRELFQRPVPTRQPRAPSDNEVPRHREQGPLEIRVARSPVPEQAEQRLPEAMEITRAEQARENSSPQRTAMLDRQELAALPRIDHDVAVPDVPVRGPTPQPSLEAPDAPSRRQSADVVTQRREIAAAGDQPAPGTVQVSPPPRRQELPSPRQESRTATHKVSPPIRPETAEPSVPDLPKQAPPVVRRPLESATAQLDRSRAQLAAPPPAPSSAPDAPRPTEPAAALRPQSTALAAALAAVAESSPARRLSRPLDLAEPMEPPRTPQPAPGATVAARSLEPAAAQVARRSPVGALGVVNARSAVVTAAGSSQELVGLPPSLSASLAPNDRAARNVNPSHTSTHPSPRYQPSPVPQVGGLADTTGAIAAPAAPARQGRQSGAVLMPSGEAAVSAEEITRAAGSLGFAQTPGSVNLSSLAAGAGFPQSPAGTAGPGARATNRGAGQSGLTGRHTSAAGTTGMPGYQPGQAPALAIGTETLVAQSGIAAAGAGTNRQSSSLIASGGSLQAPDIGGARSLGEVSQYATAGLPGRFSTGQFGGGTTVAAEGAVLPAATLFGSTARDGPHRTGEPSGVRGAGEWPGRSLAVPGTALLDALGAESNWSGGGQAVAAGQGRAGDSSATASGDRLGTGTLDAADTSAGRSPIGAGVGAFQPAARGVGLAPADTEPIATPGLAMVRPGSPNGAGSPGLAGGFSAGAVPGRRVADLPSDGLAGDVEVSPGPLAGGAAPGSGRTGTNQGLIDAPAGESLGSATAAGLPGEMATSESARSAAGLPGGLDRLDQGWPTVAMPGGRDRYSAQPLHSAAANAAPGRSTSPLLLIEEGVTEMPTPFYEQRAPGRREELAKQFGGSTETEQAVELALAFLATQQLSDGRWRLDQWNPDRPAGSSEDLSSLRSDTAATGLALLAFLGAGYTHLDHRYQSVVGSGISWLVGSQQPNGALFRPDTDPDRAGQIYAHGIASIALCEAYGMTRDPRLREPAERAVEFILAAQDPVHGGWRYTKRAEEPQWRRESDTSVSGWQLMALKSAEMAGLEVPAQAWQRAAGWLNKAQSDQGARYCYSPLVPDTLGQTSGREPNLAMTAEGLLMRMYLGWNQSQPSLRRGADYLKANLPELDRRKPKLRDAYYWYYATQVMFQMQGDHWRQWRESLWPILVQTQQQEGPSAGSWDPNYPVRDRWAHAGGRIYVTTLNVLMLEVAYRHLPLFKTLGDGSGPEPPQPQP